MTKVTAAQQTLQIQPNSAETINLRRYNLHQSTVVTGVFYNGDMVLSMNKEESDDFIFKLVYVEWIDTVSSADWDTKDNVNPKLVKQVGWVVHNDAKVIKIASTYSEEEYYSITAIPVGCILSVKSVI